MTYIYTSVLAPSFSSEKKSNLFSAMATLNLFFSFLMVTVHLISSMAANRHMITSNQKIDSNWYDAHATFYGDMGGGDTMRKYIYCVLVIATFYALHCRFKS